MTIKRFFDLDNKIDDKQIYEHAIRQIERFEQYVTERRPVISRSPIFDLEFSLFKSFTFARSSIFARFRTSISAPSSKAQDSRKTFLDERNDEENAVGENSERLRRYMQTMQKILLNLKSAKGMTKLMNSYHLYLKEMKNAEVNDDDDDEKKKKKKMKEL